MYIKTSDKVIFSAHITVLLESLREFGLVDEVVGKTDLITHRIGLQHEIHKKIRREATQFVLTDRTKNILPQFLANLTQPIGTEKAIYFGDIHIHVW